MTEPRNSPPLGPGCRAVLATALLAAFAAAAFAQQPLVPPYKSGFPLTLANQGAGLANDVFSQLAAADLGLTPGFKQIIFGLRNGKLYVIQRNGAGSWGPAPGWPVQLPSHIASSPAIGDITGDGIPEIVVGYGSTLQGAPPNSAPGGIRAYSRSGVLLWERLPQDSAEGADGFADPVMGAPAIGDVDGDGANEVVFGALDFNLYVVNGATGANKSGWPKLLRDTIFSSPALHDMDGDGKPDIIIGSDAHAEGSPFNTPDGGCIHVMRFDAAGNGSTPSPIVELPGFPKCVDQVIASSPAVGDIDGDGKPEIVHGTGTFFTNPPRQQKVYAWHCDGSPVWGTAQNPGLALSAGGQISTSPALADITGDGVLDVIFTADRTSPATDYHLYAVRGNGTQIFNPVIPRDFFGSNPALSAGEPMVADVLGDGALEILVPTNGEAAVFTVAGVQLTETTPHPNPITKFTFNTQASLSGVVVTDLETDGAGNQIEVIAVSAKPFPSFTDTEIHVWNPIPRAGTPPWGMFHQNPARTGVAPGTSSCNAHGACASDSAARKLFTVAPCRLVDTRDPNGPFGGPALASGALRDFSVFGRCGIPNTARALSANVTVVAPTAAGFVRFSPGCQPSAVSTVNFSTNQIRGNNAILAIDAQGLLTANAFVSGNGSVQVIVDINGYYQ